MVEAIVLSFENVWGSAITYHAFTRNRKNGPFALCYYAAALRFLSELLRFWRKSKIQPKTHTADALDPGKSV